MKSFRFLLKPLIVLSVILTALALWKWVLPLVLPFVLGFVLAHFMEPAVRWLQRHSGMRRALASAICTLIIMSAVLGVLSLIGYRIYIEVSALLGRLTEWIALLPDLSESLTQWADRLIAAAPTGFQALIRTSVNNIVTQGLQIPEGLYRTLADLIKNMATGFPSLLLSTGAFVLSTYFISSDYPSVVGALIRQAPAAWQDRIIHTKNHLKTTLAKWLKAQGILFLMTWAEAFLGFILLRLDYALLLATLVALVDAMPIVGSGSVLVPWALFWLFTGKTGLGVGLILLYITIALVRGLAEPKLIGYHLGLSPLAALLCLYVGFRALGVVGMIVFPVLAITIKQFHEWGYVKLWKA